MVQLFQKKRGSQNQLPPAQSPLKGEDNSRRDMYAVQSLNYFVQQQKTNPYYQTIMAIQILGSELNKQLISEGISYYFEQNLLMSKFIQKAGGLGSGGLQLQAELANSLANQGPRSSQPMDDTLLKSFRSGNLVELDLVSILSDFSSKLKFDSVEIQTLNKGLALVVGKEDI